MRILFLIRSLECGGAERQLALLANGLAAREHSVTVATFYGGGMRENDLTPAVQLVNLKKRSRWDMAGVFFKLQKLVKDLRPDIVHGYLTAGNLSATATTLSRSRGKIVWALRDSNMDMRRYSMMTRASSRLASLLSFTADGIIANSRAGADHAIRGGYPAGRVVHVPNGIDVDRFYPDPNAGVAFRRHLGLRPGQPLIGLVGRLDPMKDHECFLEAAHILQEGIRGAHSLCAGNGPTERRAKLLQKAAKLGLTDSMHWIPACGEMRALYSALDVFCLSSRYGEGFPNVLGEAMACARPCVTTDVGDSALVAGGIAAVVSPASPRMLAEAIAESLSKRSVPEARERIVKEFSVERMIETTERLLQAWTMSVDLHYKHLLA